MCGRYIAGDQDYAEYCRILGIATTEPLAGFRSFNIAPSTMVPVVIPVEALNAVTFMRFGLIPSWLHGEQPKFSTINATVEKLVSAPSWRTPWKRGQRCLIPATGFYEWHVNEDGSKQPFVVRVKDQKVFSFAGIWDASTRENGEVINSCAIITLPANNIMAEVHNSKQRMPAILQPTEYETWLRGTPQAALELITQYSDEQINAYPVSTKVNAPKNNTAELLEPIE